MDKNEHQNHHSDNDKIVRFNFPISDILYTHGFRKRLKAARVKLEAEPEAEINSTGILIISDELQEGNYMIWTSMFGSVNNIINTLANVLIERLKADAGSEKANREQVFSEFMSFFYYKAKAEFFKLYEDDEESD